MLISDEKPLPSGQHSWRQPKISSLSETLESGYCLISELPLAGFILPIVIKTTQEYMSHIYTPPTWIMNKRGLLL